MEAYLDNSSTTKVYKEAVEKMQEAMEVEYGNPSSLHKKGVIAEEYVKEAKKVIANTLKVQEKEIYFTSGGTESNNLAIIGTALANKRAGMHIITSSIEHPSVTNPMEYLKEQGFTITYLPVDKKGCILLDKLEEAMTEDTILVSIMQVNNEIGSVQPLEEISAIIKKKNPKAFFHVDGIQGYGKYVIRPKKMGKDLYSVSGHKIHGPKGVGFLYVNEKVKIKPILFGGGQQKGLRSGTENIPGISGLCVASKKAYEQFESKIKHLNELREYFTEQLLQLEGVFINGMEEGKGAPHIVSASFDGVRSEVLLHSLEEREIYVSAGSACSSNKPSISQTLTAIGVKKEHLDGTIRFSFSHLTTKEELEYTIEVLKQLLPMLRKYRRM